MSSTTLQELALRSILPPSISDDEQMLAVADGLDTESQQIVSDVERFLPYMPNLDNLPSRIVDLLAWQYHVDFYDPTSPLEVRRGLVRQAVDIHRRQGTKSAVVDLLNTIFGAGSTDLSEWFQYGGDPYWFRIESTATFTPANMETFKAAIKTVKNVRSWYEFLGRRNEDVPLYLGVATHKTIYHTSTAE